jgi:hypothetical protein
MEWILIICAFVFLGGPIALFFNNRVRARHGYAIEDSHGRLIRPTHTLIEENTRLRERVDQLEDQLRLMERRGGDAS